MVKNNKKGEAIQETQQKLKDKVLELKDFFEQAKVELKKVTWPSQKETLQTGAATLFLVIVIALFLGLVDIGLTKIIEALLS